MCKKHCKYRQKNCLQSNAGGIFSKSFKVNGEVTSLSSFWGCVWRLCQVYVGRVLGRVWGVVGRLGFCPGHLGPSPCWVSKRPSCSHVGPFRWVCPGKFEAMLSLPGAFMKDYERILGKLCDE